MDSTVQEKETQSDPFAEDIFAIQQEPGIELEFAEVVPEPKNPEDYVWFQQLKRFPAKSVSWGDLLRNLPAEFFSELPQRLADSLSRFVLPIDKKAIDLVFLVASEITKIEDLPNQNRECLWLLIHTEKDRVQIAFEIDNTFAVWLIDSVLEVEKKKDGRSTRQITKSELAVLEFLALNLINETNQMLDLPVFEFAKICPEMPSWLATSTFARQSSKPDLMQLNFQTVHRLLESIVKVYVSPDALQALSSEKNSDGKRNSLDIVSSRMQDRIEKIGTRLSIGSTKLSIGELAAIESGDVVLLEDHRFKIRGDELSGIFEIFLGSGENIGLVGKSAKLPSRGSRKSKAVENIENGYGLRPINLEYLRKISVESFIDRKDQLVDEKLMSEKDDKLNADTDLDESKETAKAKAEQISDQNSKRLAVEKLNVNLRVELSARKLSLNEVGNLRQNQILELGIHPTDSVNILVDNQIIGSGELVAVKDRLGVRITKLLR